MYKIPVYQPSLNGNEKKYVNECLDSTWISSNGKFINEFEKSFANYIGVNYSTSVSNGTVALHLALLALGIGPGHEVIVPTLTYIASVNAIVYTGATPIFVDSLESTWQMDPVDVMSKISPSTKAIMAVHLYGHPCEMDLLNEICKSKRLFLIEDCAEAIGSVYKGKKVGSFGDIATFSFYGNKTITTGEGGMLITNNQTLFERSVHFKGQGLAKHRQYWHDVLGYNYRMTNICAAIGLAQLEQVESFLEQKRTLAKLYKEYINNPIITFHEEIGDVIHSYWMFSRLVINSSKRDELRNYLELNGIETRPVFYPVHTMPMYSSKFQRLRVAELIGWSGINLPSFPLLKKDDILYISNLINQFK
jgi:perosamine synthetase